jgi:hypothetical protein
MEGDAMGIFERIMSAAVDWAGGGKRARVTPDSDLAATPKILPPSESPRAAGVRPIGPAGATPDPSPALRDPSWLGLYRRAGRKQVSRSRRKRNPMVKRM